MNIRSIFKTLKNILLYGGLSKENFNMVKEEVNSFNRKSMLFYSYFGFFIFVFLIIFTSISTDSIITKNKGIYYIGGITFALGIIFFQFFSKRLPALVHVFKYFFIIILFVVGIFLALNSYYDVTATYMVLLFVLPLLLMVRPIVVNSFIIIANIIYLSIMYRLEDKVLFSKNCVNAIVFGISSIIIGTSLMIMRFKKFKADHLNRKLMRIDILTELFNRHAYTELLNSYTNKSLETDLMYVSVDLNGLKSINDNYGHRVGDEVLKAAANCMKKAFDDYGKLFRIGGDEFVAVVHVTESEMKDAIEKLKEEVLLQNKINSLSISIGYSSIKDLEKQTFEELAHCADVKMYKDKNEYYKKNNIERRK